MKHLKLLHSLAGLLSLAVLAVEGSILSIFTGEAVAISAHSMLLLTAALVNLVLGSYLTLCDCNKIYLQALGSIALLVAPAISIVIVFGQQLEIGIDLNQLSAVLLIVGSLLHSASRPGSANNNDSDSDHSYSETYSDSGRETGTVKWFNVSKGFGFITRDSGDDVFVHYRAIRGEGHRTLSEGQRVEFVVVDKDKGLQAEDVIAAARGR